MIDITGVDLVKFVQRVYELSKPQGMGFLLFESGSLTEEEAKELIIEDRLCAVRLDYVRGRSCKMTVYRRVNAETGDVRLEISDAWYDHTSGQLAELLESVGMERKIGAESAR
jgi:hypothetical protein